MLEPIKISICSKTSLYPSMNRGIAALLFATLLSLSVTDVLAVSLNDPAPETSERVFDPRDIVFALKNPPIVPSEAQDLANSFAEITLPKLLTDDSGLARRLGFLEGMNAASMLERPFPLLRIYRDDILNYIERRRRAELPPAPRAQRDPPVAAPDPLDIINNTNNWLKGPDEKLVPKRIIFLIKTQEVTSSRLSLTLENSQSGAWRIIQVFAPKLSGALKRFESPESKQFVLWIPDLNRHYLGVIKEVDGVVSITLTTLFEDELTDRKVGEQFEATSKEFIEHLGNLYQDLNFPGKYREPRDRQHVPPAAKGKSVPKEVPKMETY